jgi:hypothetical protein
MSFDYNSGLYPFQGPYPGYDISLQAPTAPISATPPSIQVPSTVPSAVPSKKTSYIIIIVTLILSIIAIIILIVLATTQTAFFAPYRPPSSSVYYYPGGDVIKLTPQQIAARQAVLTGATGVTGAR